MIAAYQVLLRSAPTTSPLLECNDRDPRILGSDGEFQKLIADACVRFGATEIELRSASRLKYVARARTWVTDQALGTGIASVAILARYFNRDASSIRQSVDRRRSIT